MGFDRDSIQADNIAVIWVDDMIDVFTWRNAFGIAILTPNLDKFFARGVRFGNAYATVPLCAPCRAEHPRLMALKARGVAVVGVAWKDDPVATRAFLDELGDPYSMVLVDRDGRAGLDLGITGAPETFAVDAMGRIVGKVSGPLLDDAEIERLVAAMQAPPRPLPTATSR